MPDNYARIEFISAIIRIYSEKRDDSVHNTGIPFLFSVFVRWITPEQVEILGLRLSKGDRFTPSIWKAIGIELYKYGVNTVIYYRYKDGKRIEKRVSVNKKWLTEENPDIE